MTKKHTSDEEGTDFTLMADIAFVVLIASAFIMGSFVGGVLTALFF